MRLLRNAKQLNPVAEGVEKEGIGGNIQAPESGANGGLDSASEIMVTDGCAEAVAEAIPMEIEGRTTRASSPGVDGIACDAIASASAVAEPSNEASSAYSVPNTCGMTLLCLVGEDTLTS